MIAIPPLDRIEKRVSDKISIGGSSAIAVELGPYSVRLGIALFKQVSLEVVDLDPQIASLLEVRRCRKRVFLREYLARRLAGRIAKTEERDRIWSEVRGL